MKEILIDPSRERQILDFRELGFRDVLVLGRYRYVSVHPALEMHSHGSRIEICYLESGQQTYVVEDQKYDLVGGDVFATFPGERHGTGPHLESRGVLYWMILHTRMGQGRFLDLPPTQARSLMNRLLKMNPRHFPGQVGLKKTLTRIFEAYQRTDDPLRLVNLKNLMLRFLLDVLACAEKHQARGPSPPIVAVQQHIESHLDQPLDLMSLAGQTGLSLSRFKSRFKKEVGIPPAEWVMRRKMEQAEQMLSKTRLSVTEVAMHLGFSSSQYFATVFKRYTGQSPRDFRRESA